MVAAGIIQNAAPAQPVVTGGCGTNWRRPPPKMDVCCGAVAFSFPQRHIHLQINARFYSFTVD